MRRALVVEHQPDAPAGLAGDWLEARGIEVDVVRPAAGERWPRPGHHEAIVALGSDCSVHASADAWIGEEVAFLRDAHGAGAAILGLCFGGQTLAAALGGTVTPAARPEIGWRRFDASDERLSGPFFAWHADAFTVPPGAEDLARSEVCPQAFRLGRSLGLQFHPEVDGAIVDAWLDWGRSQLVEQRLDEDAIRADTAALIGDARGRAFALFDLWAGGAARQP